MDAAITNYRRLDADRIIETVKTLRGRIDRRFPGSGLSRVTEELQQVAEETVARTRWIQKPHLPLRCAAAVLSLAMIALLILMVRHIRQFNFEDYTNFIQALDSSISSVVFIGAATLFLVSCENRIKRSLPLRAIHA